MIAVPFQDLPLQIRNLGREIDDAIGAVLSHGHFILGPEVERFEASWAEYCRARHAVGVASGTDALLLILRALGIGPGDEVITVANTFIATVNAIVFAGARPVLVDCRADDLLIDPSAVEAAMTPRTRAIIAVHLYGQPADMEALGAIASRRAVALVEDAAQAHGAELTDRRRCGSLGVAAAFSFYPGKNLGAFGDAGAVTTNDPALAQRLRKLRNLGAEQKYRHEVKGYNSRLDTIQAAILSAKLRHLDEWNEARSRLVGAYRAKLEGIPGLGFPAVAATTGRHANHLCAIRISGGRRDETAAALGARGIQTGIHYPVPVHLQEAYADLRAGPGSFPAAEQAAGEVLSLPLFPEMASRQLEVVATRLEEVLASDGRPSGGKKRSPLADPGPTLAT